jgi:ribosomal protein S18 acetylase RimI-like enzyme
MIEADYDAFLDRAVREYAEDKVKAGNWSPEVALEKSRLEFLKFLPEGTQTPDQHLFSVIDDSTGTKVGMIWFGVLRSSPPPFAFVYDIHIEDQFQGRGYGKRAMLAVEDKVKALGLDRIALHVFGHNQVARSLYEKIGYEITNINMSKSLR